MTCIDERWLAQGHMVSLDQVGAGTRALVSSPTPGRLLSHSYLLLFCVCLGSGVWVSPTGKLLGL